MKYVHSNKENTKTTTNSMPSTMTNTRMEGNMENRLTYTGKTINLFECKEFMLDNFYPKHGISILQLENYEDLKETLVSYDNQTFTAYTITGTVLRCAKNEYYQNNIPITLPMAATKAIASLRKNKRKMMYVALYRSSDKRYTAFHIEPYMLDEVMCLSDEELIERIPAFRQANKSKMANLRKENRMKQTVSRVLEKGKDYSLTASNTTEITETLAKRQDIELGQLTRFALIQSENLLQESPKMTLWN